MSHVVTIKTEVKNAPAVQAACRRLNLPEPSHGTFQLYRSEVAGLGVNLPGWRYPAVFNLDTGQALFDTFGGRWGQESELHKFLQTYACERVKSEARAKGHTVTEQPLEDGSVKLTVHVGGAS